MLEKLTPHQIREGVFEYTDIMGRVVGHSSKDSSGHVHYYDQNNKEILTTRITDTGTGRTENYDYYNGTLKSTSQEGANHVVTHTDPRGYETGKTYIDDNGNMYISRVHGEFGNKTYSDIADEMELEAIAGHNERVKAEKKLKRSREIYSPSNDAQEKFRPSSACNAEDAKEYIRYAAYLLYKNGVSPESCVTETVKRKDIVKHGPFGLLSRDNTQDVSIPVARYWELRDSGEITDYYSETVTLYEGHTYTCLFPGGRIMKRAAEEKVLRDIGYRIFENGVSEIDIGNDPAGYVALVDLLLSKRKIDMNFDRYLTVKGTCKADASYIAEIQNNVKKEREGLTAPKTTEDRLFSDLHWSAAVVFLFVLITSKILPGWIPYIVQGTVFYILWTQKIRWEWKYKPLSGTVWFESIVIALTAFTMLVKSTLNRWLYQNYYNITVPQILLGCIIAIMMASAIKKLSSSGKAEATLKTTDNPLKEFPFLKILSAVVLIGAVVLRIWCKRQYDYDPFIYSVILLLAEAACIVFNVDWKICTALYVLYGLCNANDIIDLFRPNTWSYFLKLSSAGFQVTITAVLGGLVTLWVIYQGIKKTKSK